MANNSSVLSNRVIAPKDTDAVLRARVRYNTA
jgi:hypothetical protein